MSVHHNPWQYSADDYSQQYHSGGDYGIPGSSSSGTNGLVEASNASQDQVFCDDLRSMHIPTREDEYEIVSVIGAGSYGKVYCAKIKNFSELLVLKKVPLRGLEENERVWAIREAELMSKLPSHENVVKHYVSFIENEVLNIVMEYCEGGDLDNRLTLAREKGGSFSEETVWSVLIQVCYALNHMHRHRIIHRDIKPQNIFLDKFDRVKVGDLGLGRLLSSQSHAGSRVGTPLYQSPELCMTQQYDERADVWALGCVAHQMLTLKPPFLAQTTIALANKIAHSDPTPLPSDCSNNLQFLILKMLSKHPQQRPDTNRILSYGPIESRIKAAQHKAELEEVKHKYEIELDQRIKETASLAEEVDQLKRQVASLNDRYNALSPECERLKQDCEKYQQTIKVTTQENEKLKAEHCSLKTKLSNVNQVLQVTEAENASFRMRLDQFVLRRVDDSHRSDHRQDSTVRYQFEEEDDKVLGISDSTAEAVPCQQPIEHRRTGSTPRKSGTSSKASKTPNSKTPKGTLGRTGVSAFQRTPFSKKDGLPRKESKHRSEKVDRKGSSARRETPCKQTGSQLGSAFALKHTPSKGHHPKTMVEVSNSTWASSTQDPATLTPKRVFFTTQPSSDRRLSTESDTGPLVDIGNQLNFGKSASASSVHQAAEATSFQVASAVLSPGTSKASLRFTQTASPSLGPALRVPVSYEDDE